jgi:membrane fusion protein (multidrug efflux system)
VSYRAILCGIMALAACNGSEATPGAGRPGGGPGGRTAAGPVPVEVVVAWQDTVVDAITATGQIEPIQSIELRPEVGGRLVEIMAREGAEVQQGAPLFKVDDGELKAEVARASADRDLAQQALARTRQLLAEKAAAPADVERAEAQMRSTQAQLDLLTLRLERTVVRAPFTGVLGQRLASLGDFVNNQSRLISLQTVNPQRASFQVPERYAERLKVGQTVLFRVAALSSRDFSGRVDFVDPQVQLPGRTITMKALVSNPRRELQGGMFIEARLETATRPQATVIPEEAILPVAGQMFAWVVEGDSTARRQVSLGVRTPGFVEVLSGVRPGEQVVVGGAERLAPGLKVQATRVERRPVRRGDDP